MRLTRKTLQTALQGKGSKEFKKKRNQKEEQYISFKDKTELLENKEQTRTKTKV